MKLVILTILMLAIAFLLLGIKVLFVPGSRFPLGHHHKHPTNDKVQLKQ